MAIPLGPVDPLLPVSSGRNVQKSNEAEFLRPEFGGSAWPSWFRSGDVSRLTVEHARRRDPDVEGGHGIGARVLGRVEGSGDRCLLDQAA